MIYYVAVKVYDTFDSTAQPTAAPGLGVPVQISVNEEATAEPVADTAVVHVPVPNELLIVSAAASPTTR